MDQDSSDDHFHDQCGVFGIYGAPESSNLTYLGLHALQHRGQEAAGIVSSDGSKLHAHRALGLVQDAFTTKTLESLPGEMAIGHVRYSTAGGGGLKNAQPFLVEYAHGWLSVCHNGNFTNFGSLKKRLEEEGSIFTSTSDTEVLVHLVAKSKQTSTVERVADALLQVQGAYSLLFLVEDAVVAARDPYGLRPLCMGKKDGATIFASEPPAFELMGGTFEREVMPGEIIRVSARGVESYPELLRKNNEPMRMCVFEHVYFARPDSHLSNASVYTVRYELGKKLAEEAPCDADVVIPVPDSGVVSALGYANRLGLPFQLGLIRSHYVGRTFIEPSQSIRNFGVKLKLSPVRHLLDGKRVVVVDDSIVRGTTSQKIVKMLRESGAKEVHLRIASPPTAWPCFYGIDTPSRDELLAAKMTLDEIKNFVTSDSLAFVSLPGLHQAIQGAEWGRASSLQSGYCDACFSGQYPVPTRDGKHHLQVKG